MGIDPQVKLPHPQGLDVRATPTIWDAGKATRLLKEIM
jgi:hypothetical protein